VDVRRTEALRLAQSVVEQQQACPQQARIPSRITRHSRRSKWETDGVKTAGCVRHGSPSCVSIRPSADATCSCRFCLFTSGGQIPFIGTKLIVVLFAVEPPTLQRLALSQSIGPHLFGGPGLFPASKLAGLHHNLYRKPSMSS